MPASPIRRAGANQKKSIFPARCRSWSKIYSCFVSLFTWRASRVPSAARGAFGRPRPTWFAPFAWDDVLFVPRAGEDTGPYGDYGSLLHRRGRRLRRPEASPLAGEVAPSQAVTEGGERRGAVGTSPPQSRLTARQLPHEGGAKRRAHNVRPYMTAVRSPPHPALRATFPPGGRSGHLTRYRPP